MSEINERIEKQMEGTNLALAAVAEVLQKMDMRFQKEEQDDYHEQQAVANENLLKEITERVLSVVKAEGGESEQGLDVDGKERKAKGTGGTPQNADDSESSVTPTTKIEDQQNTIQAMAKLLKEFEDAKTDEGDDEEETKKGGYSKAYKEEGMDEEVDDEAADEVVEESMEKEEGEEEVDDDEKIEESVSMKSMQKQIRALKKELKASKNGMQKAVQTEAENRLRKMGFREETSLQAPKLNNSLGVEDLTPIAKAEGDVAGQLVDMSYQELRRLQQKLDSGQTDGLPRELIGK
jgi:hypothetical protein